MDALQLRGQSDPRTFGAGADGVQMPRAWHSTRASLRQLTRAQHEATEAAFEAFDLSRPEHYAAFLTAHAMALTSFELGITGHGWQGWHPRLPHLADDLAALGLALPAPIAAPPMTDSAAWGVQYVLEGSRLGAQVLVGRLYAGAPARYLGKGLGEPNHWRAFCDALDRQCPMLFDDLVDAAIATFRAFRLGAQASAEKL